MMKSPDVIKNTGHKKSHVLVRDRGFIYGMYE